MTTLLWERVEAVFSEAVERPPEARSAFLDRTCAGHDEVRREVEALLRVDMATFALDVEGSLLRETADAGDLDLEGGMVGTLVGPYRVESKVGCGGMGTVYRARRADGVFDKTVALKLVKRGMDTDEVLARFRRERQVLAGLEHVGIARLLDGGAAADGRPYLAMEYVEGEPITAYCDAHRLAVEERLALFESVCEAVLHAHRRLVIHRDLKPSNILVGENAHGARRVTLLDFGVAKLLEADTDEVLTQGLQRLTPAYAAPEQMQGAPVTMATDVYALGVVLYELLAGERPERSEAPVKPPSAVVTPEAAARRATTEESLRRRLRGDLDTICHVALRDDLGTRYPSVESLLDDLRRHREGLPLQARPASVSYRVRKFAERHRVGVAATLVVAVALVGGLGTALWQAERARAEAARAEAEAATAERVTAFLVDVFGASNPFEEPGASAMTAREVLDRGVEQVGALDEEPAVQAELMVALGTVYGRLGHYEEARALLERALAVRRSLRGEEHEEVAESLVGLGALLSASGAYELAEARYREALAMQRRLLDDDHPDVAASLNDLGGALLQQQKYDQAEPFFREALARARQLYGDEHPNVASSLANLGGVLHDRGAYAEAEALYREALTIQRKLYEGDHPNLSYSLNSLAIVLRDQGAYDEAEPFFRESLAMRQRLFGEEHNATASARHALGRMLVEAGRAEDGEPLLRRAFELSVAVNGDQHWKTAAARVGLGKALTTLGRYEEAQGYLEDAYRIYRHSTDGPPRGRAAAHEALAELYTAWGKPERVEALHADETLE